MHNLDLIFTITGGLGAALICGFITHSLKLSPIVGYLIAGILVGANTPGFVADQGLAEQLAEIGIILLMFGVGLHFHIKELLAVKRVAIPGAVSQSLVATVLGTLAAYVFGWGLVAGLVFGLALSVASTAVLVRVLTDNNDLHTRTGHIAVGWLVVEDLFTVLVLVFLPVLFGPEKLELAQMPLALGIALIKIVALVGFTLVIGERCIPWILTKMSETRSRELFTLTILVVALGIAVGSAKLFGVSMALGAFLAGMVVGRSEFSLRAASEALPMRDAFAVLFFVSVGMLFDPKYLIEEPLIVLTTLAIVIVGKPLIALLIVILLGYPVRVAIAVSFALAQIGEFSFILANLGNHLNIFPKEANNAVVAAAILSIALNPFLYLLVKPIENWLSSKPAVWKLLNSFGQSDVNQDDLIVTEAKPSEPERRAVVVGYGPVGRTVVELLRQNDIHSTIIEMNLETVKTLKEQSLASFYGDATHEDTLIAAGIKESKTLILTASSGDSTVEIIRKSKALNPAIRVIARTDYLSNRRELKEAGANIVYSGEGEVALAMAESMLRALGATPDQIDRARKEVSESLFV